jgi:branched-chain amino acid transport system substrate-binding protein
MRNERLNFFWTVLSASLLLSCSSANAQTKIGIAAPLTGPLARWGSEILQGVKLAISDLNSHGGINGKLIEVIVVDDNCRADRAAQQTETLIQRDKVSVLIGYPCAAAALASSQIAARSDILMLSLSTVPTLTQPNKPVLRIIGRADRLAQFTADYVAMNFRNKKVGILAFANQTAFNDTLRTSLDRRGVKIDRAETLAPPVTTLPAWSSNVDVMIASGAVAINPTEISRSNLTVVIPTSIISPTIANVQNDKNFVVISNPKPDFFSGATDIVRRAGFLKQDDSGYAIYGYAAVEVFASLARLNKDNFGGTALARIARETKVPTAIGQLTFDQNGDIRGWQFAAYGAASGPNVCKTPECKDYQQCPSDCPK